MSGVEKDASGIEEIYGICRSATLLASPRELSAKRPIIPADHFPHRLHYTFTREFRRYIPRATGLPGARIFLCTSLSALLALCTALRFVPCGMLRFRIPARRGGRNRRANREFRADGVAAHCACAVRNNNKRSENTFARWIITSPVGDASAY